MITQDHQRMKEEVGHFIDNLLFLSALGRDEHFAGFFCHLLQDLVVTAFQELGRVGIRLRVGSTIMNGSQDAFENSAERLR